jgi:glycerophosphoryl diester phosphodiesterase
MIPMTSHLPALKRSIPFRFPWASIPLLMLIVLFQGPALATEIVCHRGANRHAPENTWASTQLCIDWGVDYVEIDVRRSADGVMYVLHDARVDRTTDGTGFLNQLPSSDVDTLDAGSWFAPEFAGERVPRLEPFLQRLDGRIKVYFDVKDADVGDLIALVRNLGLENDSFFWFDRDEPAHEFRRLAPDLQLKVNATSVEEVQAAARDLQADIIEVRLRHLSPELAQACRDLGLEIMVYEPIEDREAFARILDLGADKVNLNHGDTFLSVQRERRAPTSAPLHPRPPSSPEFPRGQAPRNTGVT